MRDPFSVNAKLTFHSRGVQPNPLQPCWALGQRVRLLYDSGGCSILTELIVVLFHHRCQHHVRDGGPGEE